MKKKRGNCQFYNMDVKALLLTVVLLASYHSGTACPSGCQSCDDGRILCARAGLVSMPTSLPEDAFVVDLSQNEIDSVREVPNLPNAQSLKLSTNKLTVVEGRVFKSARQLMSLDLSMNQITKVYKNGLDGLENLMTISLNGNKISKIGMIFTNTPTITSIRLGNNEIESLDENDFVNNPMIKMLDLSNNKISSIHGNTFKALNVLRYLLLSNNPIVSVPELTITSTLLSMADFTNCQLTSVPRTMPPSLKDFRLGNNKLTNIMYEDFQNITSLNLLTLNDNKISDVEHRSFGSLENLHELWMSRNELVYIPRGLPVALEKFHIDNNHVVELEPMLFKTGSKLKVFSLESNNVRKVHQDSLKNLGELEQLNLQGNQITLVDVGTFVNLTKLQKLKFTNNPVQVFEAGAFVDLENLTDISLSYIEHPATGSEKILTENFLSSMPNLKKIDLMSSVRLTSKFLELFELSDAPVMSNVSTLILQYNELKTLPQNIKNIFPNAENVFLDGNPFACDSKLLWLHDWMQESSVKFYQYEAPVCNKPAGVKGKLILDLAANQFVDLPEQEQVPVAPVEQNSVNTPDNEPSKPESTGTQQEAATSKSNSNQQESDSNQDKSSPTSNQNEVSNPPQNSNSQQQHSSGSAGTRVIIKPPRSDPSNTNRNTKPDSSSNSAGTRVIIKPPRSGTSNTQAKTAAQLKREKAAIKAARKAARKAEKARKRKEKEERIKARKLRRKKDKDARRKKRRIRHSKRCKVDESGKMVCERRKKCKVDNEGHVKCRKRGGKGKKRAKKQNKG